MIKGTVIKNNYFEEKSSKVIQKEVSSKPVIYKGNRNEVSVLIEEVARLVTELKLDFLVPEIKKVYGGLKSTHFTVSVVGDFSRGKSTLVNQLLGIKALPSGNEPTTAILTKVTYNEKPMIVHIQPNGQKEAFPLIDASWGGLTADLTDRDPVGVVYVGLKDRWLKEQNIQLMDTPGTGDINLKRAAVVNDALVCSDGMIMVISALAAMSQAEKAFIEQRIIAKKVPHLMIVVTRLDQVSKEERSSVLKYIQRKLKELKVDVPIFVPQDDLEFVDEQFSDHVGIPSIKAEIASWVRDSKHEELKMKSVCTQLLNLMDIIEENLYERERVLALSTNEKSEVQKEYDEKIKQMHLGWERYRKEMFERSENCCTWLKSVVDEKQELILDRVKYEISSTSNPKVWWEKDFPYRMKIEMTAVAASIENGLSQRFFNDVRWLNDGLTKEFNVTLAVKKENISSKEDFQQFNISEARLNDLNKLKLFTRIGSVAVNAIGIAAALSTGLPFFIGSSIAGSGGSIISEKILHKNIDDQKKILQDVVAQDVPNIIDQVVQLTLQRVEATYEKVLMEAKNQEELWIENKSDILKKAALDGIKPNEVLVMKGKAGMIKDRVLVWME